MKKSSIYSKISKNKGFNVKRFNLWLYTYRKVLFIFAILLIILGSISLWLGLDFFKKHYGENQIYYGQPFNMLDKYKNESEVDKESNVDNWVKNNIISQIGTGGNSKSNISEGTMIFFGSSACSACRNQIDVDDNKWNLVKSHNVLYNYWKNLGPLNTYIKAMRQNHENAFSKYWTKYQYAPVKSNPSPGAPKTYKFNIPQPLNDIKDAVMNNSTSFNPDNNSKYTGNFGIGYDESGYSLNEKNGLPGKNNIVSIAINSIDKSFATEQNIADVTDYINSPFLTKVDFNTSSYTPYKETKDDKDNGNLDYFNDHVKNEFSLSSMPKSESDFSSITSFPFVGIFHHTYYYDPSDTEHKHKINTYKLFYTLSALNTDQLTDFIYWVYTGTPNDSKSDDAKTISWTPFWDEGAA